MPIQEEERSSGRPAAKAEQILKPVSTRNPNFIPMGVGDGLILMCEDQRTKIVIRCRSSLLYSLRHRDVGREEDAGVPYDRIFEKCKEKNVEGFKILAK